MFAAVSLMGLAAAPAFALRVTNLDQVTHTVALDGAGFHEEQTVVPNETIAFLGQPDAFLSLKTGTPRPSKGTWHADGMLAGVIGEERNQGIPAYNKDNYVIWPGGRLLLQSRTKDYGRQ